MASLTVTAARCVVWLAAAEQGVRSGSLSSSPSSLPGDHPGRPGPGPPPLRGTGRVSGSGFNCDVH
eukprot:1328780-Rhodomonas_salina.1